MFSKVCFQSYLYAAEMTWNLLEENNLHPLRLDYASHLSMAGAEQGYFIEVPDNEVALAKRILTENGFGKYIVTK
jgi:hypothetical protein